MIQFITFGIMWYLLTGFFICLIVGVKEVRRNAILKDLTIGDLVENYLTIQFLWLYVLLKEVL